MPKQVVNRPQDGIQMVQTVGSSGGWTDKSQVVYDSRIDTDVTLDESQVGGLSRVEENGKLKSLAFSQAAKDANDAKIQAIETAEQNREQKRADARESLKDIGAANTLPELKLKVQAIADYLGIE